MSGILIKSCWIGRFKVVVGGVRQDVASMHPAIKHILDFLNSVDFVGFEVAGDGRSLALLLPTKPRDLKFGIRCYVAVTYFVPDAEVRRS